MSLKRFAGDNGHTDGNKVRKASEISSEEVLQFHDDYESGDNSEQEEKGVFLHHSDDDTDEDDGLEEIVFGGKRKLVEPDEEIVGFCIDRLPGKTGVEHGAAWVDDDDDEQEVDMYANKPRGIGNIRYQADLLGDRKKEFEKAVGEVPVWASSSDKSDEQDSSKLLRTNFNYVTSSERLSQGILDFHKCPDANKEQPSSMLETCEFHRGAQICMTAGKDCRLNLFQVDGKRNAKIHSFFAEQFPIHCAHFLTSGQEILMTSQHKHFLSYDLISGKIMKVPAIKGTDEKHYQNFYVSPDGKHLIFVSRFGKVHLVSTKTKELIKTVRMNGKVADIAFRSQGQQFLAFGDEGVVTLWDIRNKGCVHSFIDDGCTFGTSLAVSPNGRYIACGSRSGIVNIYDDSCLQKNSVAPLKSFKNLQYSIYSLQFNSTSEILGMASAENDNAVRLVHVPSLTTFSNFPGMGNRHLKLVRKLDFSPQSGYLMLVIFYYYCYYLPPHNHRQLMMKGSVKCRVCDDSLSKYRCPNCRTEYCSVKCFKAHKEDPTCTKARQLKKSPQKLKGKEDDDDKPKQELIKLLKESENSSLNCDIAEYDTDRLKPDKLGLLRKSEKLQSMLSNPHLCQIIKTLDDSAKKDKLLPSLMKEPIFVEFVDECLKCTSDDH